MSENFDITIWREVGTFEDSNVMREELKTQAVGGEYIGLNITWPIGRRDGPTNGHGWNFRFTDRAVADAFAAAVESHDLPPEESGERVVERQPHEDDDVELIRPNGDVATVKRKRIESLLKKGWTLPGELKNSELASTSPDEKPKKEKKQKKKKKEPEPVKIPEPFVAKPDDWVVMMTVSTKELIRCRRHKVPYLRSVGWLEGWELYREKFADLQRLKAQYAEEMADLKAGIVALENKDDPSE